ncbi:MAG: hypothetical protein U0103_29525 [Candidatus Obscuribacterales bacterium]
MQSLLAALLLALVCAVVPQCAQAQGQLYSMPSSARHQLAYKAPGVAPSVSSQYNFDYPAINQGENTSGGAAAGSNPGFSNQPFDYSNGVSAPNSTADSWTAELSGVSNAYDSRDAASNQTGMLPRVGRAVARSVGSYAMSEADIQAARRAILSGSFFNYHGTQSSHTSRNR